MKRKVFYPNNMYWLYASIIFATILFEIIFIPAFTKAKELIYFIIFEFAFTLLLVYNALSVKIILSYDNLLIKKFFGKSISYSYLEHKFAFGGAFIRQQKLLTGDRRNLGIYRKIWIYPLDKYEQPMRLEGIYYEWNMFERSYIKLQNTIEYHCVAMGYESHIQKCDRKTLIID
jgi:hypothetical protein